jgi:hypothetical protein
MKTVIEMAQEVRLLSTEANQHGIYFEALERFAELVRADEREQGQKWFDAVTAQHKQAILAEREACANLAQKTVCDVHIPTGVKIYGTAAAKAIRSRGQS